MLGGLKGSVPRWFRASCGGRRAEVEMQPPAQTGSGLCHVPQVGPWVRYLTHQGKYSQPPRVLQCLEQCMHVECLEECVASGMCSANVPWRHSAERNECFDL